MVEPVLVNEGAAIFRRAGGFWLGDLESGPGTSLDGDPGRARALQGMSDGRWAHGGVLPQGASAAAVRLLDGTFAEVATGHGAWLFVTEVERHRLPVRFSDQHGRIVRPQLPHAWPREPVADADEACPVCDGREWEHVIALDGSRGASGPDDDHLENNGVVVCVRCGYEVGTGGLVYAFEDDSLSEHERDAAVERHLAERRERETAMLGGLDFPVYEAMGDWPEADIGGYGGTTDTTTTVTLEHAFDDRRWLRIQTQVFENEPWLTSRELARQALTGAVHDFGSWPPDLSEPALSLWLDARELERDAVAASASQSVETVRVDDVALPSVVLRAGSAWSAAADHGDLRLVLTARGVPSEDLRLQQHTFPKG